MEKEENERIDDFGDLDERTRCKIALQEQQHRHRVQWAVLAVVFTCSVGSLIYLAVTNDERPITFVVGLLLGQKLRKRSNDPPG